MLDEWTAQDKRSFMEFSFNTSAGIRCGTGLAARLGELAGSRLGDKVLFVTDKGLFDLGLCRAAIASLEAAGCAVTLFDETEPDPSLGILLRAIDRAKEIGASGIVGFGGGSSMDLAKLAALVADHAWHIKLRRGLCDLECQQ